MKDIFDLTGKTAIVTGGAGHLGRAICEGLAQYGADIAVASRDGEKCREFAEYLHEKYGTNAIGISGDVNDTENVRNMLKTAAGKYEKIDVLFNNAFTPVKGFIKDMDDETWERGMEGTIGGVWRCVREVIPYMLERKRGKIINIASMYGIIAPDPAPYGDDGKLNSPACYGAGKAAVIQFTRYIASYYGKYGVTSNCISPGPFPNPETQKNVYFINKLNEKTMLGRIGHPDDLKGIAVFLASGASDYITGQNICVDGGFTAR
jgi:NAD(P)-dependent dehydrogenase (short-subunit alcohol dehydrogenase family)